MRYFKLTKKINMLIFVTKIKINVLLVVGVEDYNRSFWMFLYLFEEF